MKNEMTVIPFQNSEFGEIRILDRDGDPWFVAKDVASVLGYSNTKDAVKTHCRDGVAFRSLVKIPDALGRMQEVVIISELNVNRLIMRSKLPKAEAFQDWVCGEVIPSIRKTGKYQVKPKTQRELLKDALKEIIALEEENKSLELQLDESKEWYTIKRVAAINKMDWRDLSYIRLKGTSRAKELDVKKIFDANYGEVNSYHISVWKFEYPELSYEEEN
jgi:prophage antirepressor-like protein